MRPARLLFISVTAAALMLAPARTDAITLKEIVQLSRAGLGDEVLLALIEVEQRVFAIDSETLRTLKEQGLSERVIVALIRSGRMQPAQSPAVEEPTVEAPAPAPEPPVVVIERERPVVREVAVPVPIYVPVVTVPRARHHRIDDEPRKPAEPVYWGWGGKRRPDTWQESPPEKRKR